MTYFSRLTDIVTCNLSQLLAEEENPQEAIARIINEMEEGLAGAKRSVATASANEARIKSELNEHRSQVEHWLTKAKAELATDNEDQARLALIRKTEVEDVIAGMTQQQEAAVATREHMTTMQRALEARLADARRKQQELTAGQQATTGENSDVATGTTAIDDSRADQIQDELEALKRELGK